MRKFLMILLFTGVLFGAGNAEINAIVDAIVASPPETRYEKVNAFKAKMRELNAQQRQKALEILQQKMYPQLDPANTAQALQQAKQPAHPMQQNSNAQQQMRLQQQQLRMQDGSGGGGNKQNMPGTPQQKNKPGQPMK
jgi:enoyl-CoA hydratase/carnithine racemase